METFTRQLETTKAPSVVVAEALAQMTAPLSQWGYTLTTQSESGLTFVRRYRPWYVWALIIGFFPIGLLFLLMDTYNATITVSLLPQGDRTVMTVTGQGEAKVREAFETMQL